MTTQAPPARSVTAAAIDPITVEVIRNAFNSIATQMNNNLARSAYTPIIYEMKDCSVGLFDATRPAARSGYRDCRSSSARSTPPSR